MNRRRWDAVRKVLADCLLAPTEERLAIATRQCGADTELAREVESLLRASAESEGYFERLSDRADDLTLDEETSSLLHRTVGHYRVTGTLGAGGMGEVYRAVDERLHRDVALKILSDAGHGDPSILARFDREATALASINHPNIASIYGREEIDGRPVLVLELVDGSTLADRLADGPLPLDEALHLGRGIARGLEAAHEKGIVHRDLKPSNVMLTHRGEVKVLDFGIAKPLPMDGLTDSTPDLTAAGVLLGTVPYMSPEQVRGLEVDQRTDVWAFGCLLYEMLTGSKAFERETVADTLAAIIDHEPRTDLLPTTTPVALKELLERMLVKRVMARLGSVEEVCRRLESIIAGRTTGELAATVGAADALERARTLIARHAWQAAFDLLDPLWESLDADDLARLGEAAWWVGRLDRSIEADQRAFSIFLAEAGSESRAAEMAIRLADHNSRKLQPALVNGWLQRAERLLERQPLSPAHGWLLRARIQQANSEGRHDAAELDAGRLLEIGSELGDRDLQAVAIHYQGMAQLYQGHTASGMTLIDEAAVAAISGELSPKATSIIYCNAISACRSMADYRRAGEWTAAAKRWCDRQAISGFPGICRVVRAEVMRLHGNWADAEKEVRQACVELESFAPSVVRVAFHELGEVRLRIGDLEGAREAFRSARQLGRDPQPGESLLKLAEGDVEGAAGAIKRALQNIGSDRIRRARLLPAQVEIALRRDDFDTARMACEELQKTSAAFESPVVRGAMEHACGALCLAEGDVDAAAAHLRAAIAIWGEARMPYEEAQARELQAHADEFDGDEVSARLELQAACETFVQLGAVPDSRRVAEKIADHWK